MKIVVDINHPAHVHYFRNFIPEMEKQGHEILVTASEKDIALKLLDIYHISYVPLGSYGKGLIRKIVNLPILDWRMLKAVRKFDPDVFIGFGSIRAAHIGWFLRRKSIILDDTEHAKFGHMLYKPFASVILTPECFQKELGVKQIRYKGYTELFYLHPDKYTPDPSILSVLGLTETDRFFIVRFVAFDAHHDVGQTGIHNKIEFVNKLSNYGRVLITSEGDLPPELEEYRYRAPLHKMHDLLYYATLFIGESSTMASEAACLGTHAIYVNTLRLGYTDEEEEKYKLVYTYSEPLESDKVIMDKIHSLLDDNEIKQKGKAKRKQLLETAEDPTSVLIGYVENMINNKI